MSGNKKRIDILMVEKDIASSREQAKKMIMAGCVYANNQKVLKASVSLSDSDNIEVRNFVKEFVSRGGYKLKKAIKEFNIDLTDKIAADIGSSTGGFTDCMLQNGAKKVFAIDSGYGQLDWKMRNDDRVVSLERCNARFLDEDTLDDRVDFVSIDVSFISVKLIFPAVQKIANDSLEVVCLIKPQFEAGKENVGKNGVVRDKSVHKDVITNVLTYASDNGLFAVNIEYSPIKGPKGNIEYLLYLKNQLCDNDVDANDIVEKAWQAL